MYGEIFISWILQLFAVKFFIYLFFFWKTFFYPRQLPTPTPTTHTHDPRPLPTTHDPRHLATLVHNWLSRNIPKWRFLFVSKIKVIGLLLNFVHLHVRLDCRRFLGSPLFVGGARVQFFEQRLVIKPRHCTISLKTLTNSDGTHNHSNLLTIDRWTKYIWKDCWRDLIPFSKCNVLKEQLVQRHPSQS